MNIERAKTEEENKMKRIAASIAREIEYFWLNIEHVSYIYFTGMLAFSKLFYIVQVVMENNIFCVGY